MAVNNFHDDSMAIALQLQSEFSRSGTNRANSNLSGRRGRGRVAAGGRQVGQAFGDPTSNLHQGGHGSRGGYEARAGFSGRGRDGARGCDGFIYRGPHHLRSGSDFGGDRSNKEVDDFFNLEDKSDIVAGEVLYYQDQDYEAKIKEKASITINPILKGANDPVSDANSGKGTAMNNSTMVRYSDTSSIFGHAISPRIPVNVQSGSVESDFYQENYKEKYEAGEEQRQHNLSNADQSTKTLQTSRHASQADMDMMDVDTSRSAGNINSAASSTPRGRNIFSFSSDSFDLAHSNKKRRF